MRFLSLLPLVGALLLVAGCASHQHYDLRTDSPYRDLSTLAQGDILHARTGRLLAEDELYEFLSAFRVVYVGESHDNADDHAVQLKILKALSARFPGGVALGLEMLQRPSQPKVDAYLRGELEEKEFAKVWSENWGASSYADYREILRYARERSIPIVALNAGDELKKAVRERGTQGLEPELARELPELHEDEYHRAVTAGFFAGHAVGARDVEAFQRIQVLWDETMAQTAADYLKSEAGKGKRLVVLAGGAHVRHGLGIPRRVFLRAPLPFAIVEPFQNRREVKIPKENLMDVELPDLPMPAADVYWSVGYEVPPRVMLGVTLEAAGGKGARVLGIMPGSPAEKAGLQKGDLIVSIDGKPVRDPGDLSFEVGLHQPGDTGPLEVEREGRVVSLTVTYRVLEHGR
jgi:uncharacterized iron-regulated protein